MSRARRLSKTQLNALTLLVTAGPEGGSPYSLGIGLNTLWALVRRGLASHRPEVGDIFFPRQQDFVLTEAGFVEYLKQQPAETHRTGA